MFWTKSEFSRFGIGTDRFGIGPDRLGIPIRTARLGIFFHRVRELKRELGSDVQGLWNACISIVLHVALGHIKNLAQKPLSRGHGASH